MDHCRMIMKRLLSGRLDEAGMKLLMQPSAPGQLSLGDVQKRLQSDVYTCPNEFAQDVRQVFVGVYTLCGKPESRHWLSMFAWSVERAFEKMYTNVQQPEEPVSPDIQIVDETPPPLSTPSRKRKRVTISKRAIRQLRKDFLVQLMEEQRQKHRSLRNLEEKLNAFNEAQLEKVVAVILKYRPELSGQSGIEVDLDHMPDDCVQELWALVDA